MPGMGLGMGGQFGTNMMGGAGGFGVPSGLGGGFGGAFGTNI